MTHSKLVPIHKHVDGMPGLAKHFVAAQSIFLGNPYFPDFDESEIKKVNYPSHPSGLDPIMI
jgi:hypothetical protein